MEVVGKVKAITPEQQVTASYTKRELVVTTDEQYPQSIMIEFGQGKCNNDLDKLVIGDEVKVSINLGGREWANPQGETKYFNSIKGWRLEKVQSETAPTQTTPMSLAQVFAPAPTIVNESEQNDLPF
jgi:translation initiation factor IF-3